MGMTISRGAKTDSVFETEPVNERVFYFREIALNPIRLTA